MEEKNTKATIDIPNKTTNNAIDEIEQMDKDNNATTIKSIDELIKDLSK